MINLFRLRSFDFETGLYGVWKTLRRELCTVEIMEHVVLGVQVSR